MAPEAEHEVKLGLSFIIPAYNAAAFLPAALDSALSQDLGVEFEIVVVDDASTDATPGVLEDYRARFPDLVRVFRNDENLGGGGTRNVAVRHARGDLLYVLDSDNIIPEGMARKVLDHHRVSGLEACSVEHLKFFHDTPDNLQNEWVVAHTDGRSGLRHLLTSVAVTAAHGNYLYTRALFEAVGGYEEDRGAMDTWTFGLKHAVRGFDVAIAPGTFYFHRVGRLDSFWILDEEKGLNDPNAIAVLKEHLDELPPDLAAKVDYLDPSDKLFQYVEAGLFRETVSQEKFASELERRSQQGNGQGLVSRLRLRLSRPLRRG